MQCGSIGYMGKSEILKVDVYKICIRIHTLNLFSHSFQNIAFTDTPLACQYFDNIFSNIRTNTGHIDRPRYDARSFFHKLNFQLKYTKFHL